MGIKIAGVDVSGIIAREIGQGVLREEEHDAILVSVASGTRTGNLTGGTNPTETRHTCKAFIDSQNRESVGGTLVDAIEATLADDLTVALEPDDLSVELD